MLAVSLINVCYSGGCYNMEKAYDWVFFNIIFHYPAELEFFFRLVDSFFAVACRICTNISTKMTIVMTL